MPKSLTDPAVRAHLGGLARAAVLTPEQRSAIARLAVRTRHAKTPKHERQQLARRLARARWKVSRSRKKSRLDATSPGPA